MDELRKTLKQDKTLVALAERLSDSLGKADPGELIDAPETGNIDQALKLIGLSTQELQEILDVFKSNASVLEKQFPDLAMFARSMKVAGSL